MSVNAPGRFEWSDFTGRRTASKRLSLSVLIAVVVAGLVSVLPGAAEAFGPKVDPRWRPMVAALREYVKYAYTRHDEKRAEAALVSLKTFDIAEADLAPIQNINRYLIPKNMFLTCSNADSGAVPVVKLFLVAKTDVFDGFIVGDRKKTTLFGKKLGAYRRVLLGEEVFSSAEVPPVALAYNLAQKSPQNPDWVIAIPYGSIQDLNRSADVRERLVEELTIHEIAHIVYETRDELIPFLAQFGYRMDDDRPMTGVADLIGYLKERRLTYHEPERLVLDRIYNADAYYGSSGNVVHLKALRQIKEALVQLSEEVNRQDRAYPKNLLRISDQQCYASMTLLYHRALEQLAALRNRSGGLPNS
jgi:hypothetical protein